mmetsp:Transcript_3901/g.6664  ORF Transcript_3901/g.6664 Transcript_3901/m.6664 type:complete len:291 (+) Transcript_3901:1509-2381(+)
MAATTLLLAGARLDEGEIFCVIVQGSFGVENEESAFPVSTNIGGSLQQVSLLEYRHVPLLHVQPHARLDFLGHLALEGAHLHGPRKLGRTIHMVREASHASLGEVPLVVVVVATTTHVRVGFIVIRRIQAGGLPLEVKRDVIVEGVHIHIRARAPVLHLGERLVNVRLHHPDQVEALLEEGHVRVDHLARGLDEEASLRVVNGKERPSQPEPVRVVSASGVPKFLLGLLHHVVVDRLLQRQEPPPARVVLPRALLRPLLSVPHGVHRPKQHVVELVDHQEVHLASQQVVE